MHDGVGKFCLRINWASVESREVNYCEGMGTSVFVIQRGLLVQVYVGLGGAPR